MGHLRQIPAPGKNILCYQGDSITFKLFLAQSLKGKGWLRTNIGGANIYHQEVIAQVEQNSPRFYHDWHDLEMSDNHDGSFSITLPLLEIGYFEAKTFLLGENDNEPMWPQGENVFIKVESVTTCCANMVYTAFVRQFNTDRKKKILSGSRQNLIHNLDKEGFTVIPKSGSFRALMKEVDFIINKLGFRIIQLLPIHPIPTTYARMGRFGSPFAALDFTDVNPALAEFDKKTTPLDQLCELADTVHRFKAKLFIDIPVNHTGWASSLQIHHPKWFKRNYDNTFQAPGAWGVIWADLSQLDYSQKDLWQYMADVFLFWCKQGIDGFRCDAGYMVPLPAWEYIVAKVRYQHPDTVFMLEGLGGPIETMEALLAKANLNWAYSELFQNYSQKQISAYLPESLGISQNKGPLIHFAETHDNNRLAANSPSFARLRVATCALYCQTGAFGITNGVEWFASEKIDVHKATSLNWGSEKNQINFIKQLNTILSMHPCFYPPTEIKIANTKESGGLALLRKNGMHALLILINHDLKKKNMVSWLKSDFRVPKYTLYDLLSGRRIIATKSGNQYNYTLNPAEVLCLSHDYAYLRIINDMARKNNQIPIYAINQRLKLKIWQLVTYYRQDISNYPLLHLDKEISIFLQDPIKYCLNFTETNAICDITIWRYPQDLKRLVMVPPKNLLYLEAAHSFSLDLSDFKGIGRKYHECSIQLSEKCHFVLLFPPKEIQKRQTMLINMRIYGEPDLPIHNSVPILFLTPNLSSTIDKKFDKKDINRMKSHTVCTNGRGTMAQIRAAWGEIHSKYDALLAGNLNAHFPVDRHTMFTRCNTWLIYKGYSYKIDFTYQKSFAVNNNSAQWEFQVPAGCGFNVHLIFTFTLIPDKNCVVLRFERKGSTKKRFALADNHPVILIVRPDIDDRCNHEITKAFKGPEHHWRTAIHYKKQDFIFTPSAYRQLHMESTKGNFIFEPEWYYSLYLALEAERGQDASLDLFSPGYFSIPLKGGENATLRTRIIHSEIPSDCTPISTCHHGFSPTSYHSFQSDFKTILHDAMHRFIVRRDKYQTVIAGYPWFLDWGRDTLICLRGMLAAGFIEETKDILKQFAHFEEQGTLPNMIRGNDCSNRNTSDAPLWFFVACQDLINTENKQSFLDEKCDENRSIRDILISIAESYINGTCNGIKMDCQSGLIFSPAHFTWMDTNFPACSPRQGYPVEIQALWFNALAFLTYLDPHQKKWKELNEQVAYSLNKFFVYHHNRSTYLYDCLQANKDSAAAWAKPDDALRPNQLLAITLGVINNDKLNQEIIYSCEQLLVPGAIRSLADKPVSLPLAIYHDSKPVNNPYQPYQGVYRGEENVSRKLAYHNGTAWTWLFPSYCEALFLTYGTKVKKKALALLSSSTGILNQDCINQIPEIVDGDYPHEIRGCGAQAWGVTELYRVYNLLYQA